MSFTTLFSVILLSATSVLGHYPFGYPGFQTQLSPLGPNLVYTSGSAADGLGLAGFSYFNDFGLAKSGDPFSAGVDFNSEKIAVQDPKADEKVETSSVQADAIASTTVAPVDLKDSKMTPAPEEKVDATTASPDGKDIDSKDPEVVVALINGQLLSGGSTGFGSPYPILRFGGSASYYSGVPTPFTGFPGYSGYQAPEYFRPQYEPATDYFPYQSGNSPFYPSLDEDFYNPTFPFVYQHPGVVTPEGSAQTTTSSPSIDRRMNSNAGSEPKVETTTEQILTKPDDTGSKTEAEALPTPAAESKEATTVADSAAESKEATTVADLAAESKEATTVADSAALP